jgi:hypothetical protein
MSKNSISVQFLIYQFSLYSVKSENHHVENEVQARAVSSHRQNRVVIHLLFFKLNFYNRFVGTTGEE